MQWKMPWSWSTADSPGYTFSMSCHITCAEHPRSLVRSTEKPPPQMDAPNITVKDGANCKWVRDPVCLGSTKDFWHHLKRTLFFLNLVRKPLLCSAVRNTVFEWCGWHGEQPGTHSRENNVLTNQEDCGWWGNFALDVLRPLLLHSKGSQYN